MLTRLRCLLASAVCIVTLAAASAVSAATDVQWLGHAALKITSPGGKVILIDPFILKNPKTPEAMKDLSALGPVDLILITHGHGDHIGDSVELAKLTGAKVALNADMGRTFVTSDWLGMDQLIRFNKSGPIKPLGPDITITMVRAEHSSEVLYRDPATGQQIMRPGGEPAGYIIEFEDGTKIYHAGDTGVFADMAFIGEYYRPDVAFLPIGGHFTMDPDHAAYAIKNLLKTKTVVPIHYGTFPILTGTPEQLKAALGDFPTEVVVMEPGETRSF